MKQGISKWYAAEFVGINETSIRKRLHSQQVPRALDLFKPTFIKDQEEEDVATHTQAMDYRFFGITYHDLLRLAYEYAIVTNLTIASIILLV